MAQTKCRRPGCPGVVSTEDKSKGRRFCQLTCWQVDCWRRYAVNRLEKLELNGEPTEWMIEQIILLDKMEQALNQATKRRTNEAQ